MEEKITIIITIFNADYDCLSHTSLLSLIIFNKELGSLTGTTFIRPGPVINEASHAGPLKGIGWVLLLISILISLI